MPAVLSLLAGCGSSAAPAGRVHAPTSAGAVTPAVPAATPSARRATPARPPRRLRDTEARAGFVLARRPADAHAAPRPGRLAPARRAAPVKRAAPAASGAYGVSPGAPSDAEVRAELNQMHQVLKAERQDSAVTDVSLLPKGGAQPPAGAPEVIARIVAAGNAIAHFPYVYGGGHRSFVDSAYDCSGSVSYALAAGGMLNRPLTSGALKRWGAPGRGRWLTVYAAGGHVFMYVGGLRFDTSFRAGPFGSRWQAATRASQGFVARHWPGL